MTEKFIALLSKDGKKNSIRGVPEVIELILADEARLGDLYRVISHDDPWVRMRAMDAFEKICRVHPEWIEPYIDRIQTELSTSTQASIQWHIAEIYPQVNLNDSQKQRALDWLKDNLQSADVDWIVASNTMLSLDHFVRNGDFPAQDFIGLLQIQTSHRSNAVVKRVNKLLKEYSLLP